MDDKKQTCPICSEPTFLVYGKYPRKDGLCRDCSQKLFNNELKQCEKCGKWLKIIHSKRGTLYETCHCEEILKKETQENEADYSNVEEQKNENIIVINSDNKSRCITCGKKTDGLLFCSSCYQKYCNKELLFKITSCSNVELLDENYEGRYTCKDGHIVKSKSEREIDNFLFEKGIAHAYEKTLPYGKTEKEVLHPDFYLPNYLGQGKHVYIEHWGYNENNLHYEKTKKFKMPIYEKLGITLICTYEKTDTNDIDASLERKLNKANIDEGKIND